MQHGTATIIVLRKSPKKVDMLLEYYRAPSDVILPTCPLRHYNETPGTDNVPQQCCVLNRIDYRLVEYYTAIYSLSV